MDAQAELRKLLGQIRAASNSPVVERASNQIEVLCRAYMEPDQAVKLPADLEKHFSKSEAAILRLLWTREGQIVSKSACMDAIYHHSDTEPAMKIVDVFICRLRKKLENTGILVETIWGIGYRLSRGEKGASRLELLETSKEMRARNREFALKTADRMMAA